MRRHDAHREIHRLRAGIDREPAACLRHDERDLSLQRHLLDRLRAVDALDDHVGVVEGAVDVAFADAPVVVGAVVGIDVAPLVDLRCAGIECLPDVEERRSLLVPDLDRLERRQRGGLRLGGDRRDRLPLVPDVRLREQRLVGRDAQALQVPVDVLRNVEVRDDRMHALQLLGLARVERRDPRVMMRRAKRLHPEVLPDPDVVDVLRAAGDVTDTVVAREPRADGLHAGLPLG